MSAGLLHVIAYIIRRLTRDRPSVALATRFDKFERIASDPQPSLFQRRFGQRNEGPEQRRRDALAKSGAPVASASSLHAELPSAGAGGVRVRVPPPR